MKFFTAALVAVLAAIAEAQVAFTNTAYNVQAGKPFTLKWSGNSGPVTITLKNGPQNNLKDVSVIANGQSGNSFVWNPPANLASGIYAFEIADGGDTNFSPQFTFQAGAAPPSSSASGSSSSSGAPTSSQASTSGSSSAPATTTASSSAKPTSSGSSNSTSSATSSSSRSSSTGASSTGSEPTSAPTNTNDGQRYQSPLALVLVTVAALLYFN